MERIWLFIFFYGTTKKEWNNNVEYRKNNYYKSILDGRLMVQIINRRQNEERITDCGKLEKINLRNTGLIISENNIKGVSIVTLYMY